MTSSASCNAILVTEEGQRTIKVNKEKLSIKSKFFKSFFNSKLTKQIEIEGESLPGYVIDRKPKLLEKIIANSSIEEFEDWNEALELLHLAHELLMIPFMNKCADYLAKRYTWKNFAQLFKSGCLVNSNILINMGQRFLFSSDQCHPIMCCTRFTRMKANCIKPLDEASLNVFMRLGLKQNTFEHWDELAQILKEYWMEKGYNERKHKLDDLDTSFQWKKVRNSTIKELYNEELLSSDITVEILLETRNPEK